MTRTAQDSPYANCTPSSQVTSTTFVSTHDSYLSVRERKRLMATGSCAQSTPHSSLVFPAMTATAFTEVHYGMFQRSPCSRVDPPQLQRRLHYDPRKSNSPTSRHSFLIASTPTSHSLVFPFTIHQRRSIGLLALYSSFLLETMRWLSMTGDLA